MVTYFLRYLTNIGMELWLHVYQDAKDNSNALQVVTVIWNWNEQGESLTNRDV
jgi:hypothetical protein